MDELKLIGASVRLIKSGMIGTITDIDNGKMMVDVRGEC